MVRTYLVEKYSSVINLLDSNEEQLLNNWRVQNGALGGRNPISDSRRAAQLAFAKESCLKVAMQIFCKQQKSSQTSTQWSIAIREVLGESFKTNEEAVAENQTVWNKDVAHLTYQKTNLKAQVDALKKTLGKEASSDQNYLAKHLEHTQAVKGENRIIINFANVFYFHYVIKKKRVEFFLHVQYEKLFNIQYVEFFFFFLNMINMKNFYIYNML
jgi:hypothetical protein